MPIDRSTGAQLRHFGRFILRSPLLPASAWLTTDPDERQRYCAAVLDQPDVREALYLGSESLSDEVDARDGSEWSAKLSRGVAKYVARMCTRSTPFGLFATVSSGEITDTPTSFSLAPRSEIRRRSRIDSHALDSFCVRLNGDEAIRSTVPYAVNDTAVVVGDRLHYVEVVRGTAAGRQLRLTSAERDAALDLVLQAPAWQTRAELARHLCEALKDDGIETSDAVDYINELIEAQILRSTLWPMLTGDDPAAELIEQLERIDHPALAAELKTIVDRLASVDGRGASLTPAEYDGLPGAVAPDVKGSKFVQVDTFRPAAANLRESDVASVIDAVSMLASIGLRPPPNQLASFCRKFEERYGDREVPLLEALDEDAGIGFESPEGSGFDHAPLLNGIALAKPKPTATIEPAKLMLLARLMTDSEAAHCNVVRLTAADAEVLAEPATSRMATTIAAIVTIEQGPGDESTILLKTAGSTCGANMMARFCGMDRSIDDLVQAVCRHDEALETDAVVAEIVHSAGGRDGNVVARPVLRQYEIELLSRSGTEPQYRIPVNDLMLSIVRSGPVLRSARLNRIVQPKLTTAHNVLRGIPAYRFLQMLDAARVRTSLNWNWGPLIELPFLPRVMWKRVVVSRARWTIPAMHFEGNAGAALAEWRRARRVPRWVSLLDGDNELPLDLDRDTDRELLQRAVRKGPTAVCELFPAPGLEVGRSPEGSHFGEFLIPLRTKTPISRHVHQGRPGSERRPFGTSSRWRYAKVYAGASELDDVLVRQVPGLAADLAAANLLDKWFFIRYFDPESHLRLRFRARSEADAPELHRRVDQWLGALLEAKRCWRVQLDTYDREVNRYGGPERIDIAEELFALDSALVVDLLSRVPLSADDRWLAGLAGVHDLLDALNLSIEQRQKLMAIAAAGLSTEFSAGKTTKVALGHKYRIFRGRIVEALSAESRYPLDANLRPLFAEYRERMREIGSRLIAFQPDGTLPRRDGDIVLSVIHMRLNRLLLSSHRPQELVIYDWLARTYESWSRMRQ